MNESVDSIYRVHCKIRVIFGKQKKNQVIKLKITFEKKTEVSDDIRINFQDDECGGKTDDDDAMEGKINKYIN